MPFVRPIVYVYQEFTNVTVAPAVPDLHCCLVGPCYHIMDYPTDKTDIYTVDFIKSGYTKDAASAADGSSAGRPDAGTTFVTLTEPPDHTAGGVLDADSVDVIFDEALIELNFGDDGAIVDDTNVFTASTHGDFIAKKVAAGDRIVLAKSDGTVVVVKYVKAVTDANNLELTSTKKSTELIGNTAIRWRIEHALVSQHIDKDAYVVVVGNTIAINTTPSSILLPYEDLTWKVNYAKIYVGYREMRTDLQDVKTLNNTDAIEALLGAVDERNPLAVGAQVAFANTNTPIQVFAVGADTLAGQTSARDRMSTREDIYAIVPLTDSVSGASWVSVISMWKGHCMAYADPLKSKFRIVIGSYDLLPTEKASAPASTTGFTETVTADAVDVFVDPHVDTEFVTLGVGATHVLDIARSASIQTLGTWGDSCGETPFKTAYAPKALLGAMGEKRLRLAAAISAVAAQAGDYAVRAGLTARLNVVSGLAEADDGTYYRIDGTAGDFSGAAVGDIAALTDASSGVNNDGYRIRAVEPDGSKITLDLKVTGKTGITVKVKTYRASDAGGFVVTGCGITASTRRITKTAGFSNAVVGDLALVLRSDHATQTVGNVGTWVVSAVDASGGYIQLGGSGTLANDAGTDTNVVILHTVAARGGAAITTRKRLTRLRDNSASFLTTVNTGELIEIPYPADADPTKWDTATTSWAIDEVISNELLAADLDDLEELAPELFIAGFNGDCPYRIAITLDKDSQVEELNTITASLSHMRCVMTWPNEVSLTSDVLNNLTGVQSHQKGQYLACAVGAMVAGLPSNQGLTYFGIGGIATLYNSNFYFTDDQLTALRNGGWYVFVQDGESSLPYTIHEVTTDVSAYEFGELMNVKNFDYIAISFKSVLIEFLGIYNILPETITTITESLGNRARYLQSRSFPKIGAPLLSATIGLIEQTEADMLDIYMEITMPKVLNKIGLHLKA